MDANECLRQLRQAIQVLRLRQELAVHHNQEPDYWLDQLLDSAEALDEWLSQGGFLPSAWRTR